MDKTQYIAKHKINELWESLANSKKASSQDMAAYTITKAIFSKSNEKLEVAKALLLRAFTPITNKNKLRNGDHPFQGLIGAINLAYWSVLHEKLDEAHKATFKELVKQLCKEKWEDSTYCYILTRTDIPAIHQLVQTAHATMLAGQRYPSFDAKNLHFCILKGGNETELRATGNKLTSAGVDFATFWEPDAKVLWGGLNRKEITSLACKPMRKSFAQRKKLFDGSELLTI